MLVYLWYIHKITWIIIYNFFYTIVTIIVATYVVREVKSQVPATWNDYSLRAIIHSWNSQTVMKIKQIRFFNLQCQSRFKHATHFCPALVKSALKKPPSKFNFFHTFGIPSSSRHEKHRPMLQTLFWLFQCSKNPRWLTLK